jgi:ABC-type sugar transport system substrate-binding protein
VQSQIINLEPAMYLVAIAWMYVVLMMAVAEAVSSQGTVVGAVITFVLYGILPLGLVMYILGTPGRKRVRKLAEDAAAASAAPSVVTSVAPNSSGHAASDAVAPERKES